jgi:hypothetical protein
MVVAMTKVMMVMMVEMVMIMHGDDGSDDNDPNVMVPVMVIYKFIIVWKGFLTKRGICLWS